MCETTSQDAFIAGSACHTVLRKTWVKYQVRQATKYSFLFQGLSLTCSSEGTRRKLFSLLGLLSWSGKSLISKSRHRKCSLLTFPDLHISALPWLGGVPQSSVQLGAEGGSLGRIHCHPSIPMWDALHTQAHRLSPGDLCSAPSGGEASLGKGGQIWQERHKAQHSPAGRAGAVTLQEVRADSWTLTCETGELEPPALKWKPVCLQIPGFQRCLKSKSGV